MRPKLMLIRLLTITLLALPLLIIANYCNPGTSADIVIGGFKFPKRISLEEILALKRDTIIMARTFGNESIIVLSSGEERLFAKSLTQLEDLKLKKLRLPRINQSYIVNENCGCYTTIVTLQKGKVTTKFKVNLQMTKEPIDIPEKYEGLVEYLFSECPSKHQ